MQIILKQTKYIANTKGKHTTKMDKNERQRLLCRQGFRTTRQKRCILARLDQTSQTDLVGFEGFFFVGDTVGFGAFCFVGEGVFRSEGFVVGDAADLAVGDAVRTEGLKVGTRVGALVGDLVGGLVGDRVGAFVRLRFVEQEY